MEYREAFTKEKANAIKSGKFIHPLVAISTLLI